MGVFNKTIIPLALVGYEMIIANEERSAELAIIISYPTHPRGIIVNNIYFSSMQNYFRRHAPCESAPYGISPEVMDTYVKSCGMCKLDSPQDGCCFFP